MGVRGGGGAKSQTWIQLNSTSFQSNSIRFQLSSIPSWIQPVENKVGVEFNHTFFQLNGWIQLNWTLSWIQPVEYRQRFEFNCIFINWNKQGLNSTTRFLFPGLIQPLDPDSRPQLCQQFTNIFEKWRVTVRRVRKGSKDFAWN